MAFIPRPTIPKAPQTSKARFTCSQQPVSRRDALALLAVTAASTLLPSAASAKNGEGLEKAFSKVLFPKQGFNAPDALVPSDKVVNREALSTKEAKAALAHITSVDDSIKGIYQSFKADPQVEISKKVSKAVSISELRNALNVVNEAIDEQGQIETDKVVRGIIQDIGELEMAAAVKKGSMRTKKKIERTDDWFLKLTGDFNRLLSFYV